MSVCINFRTAKPLEPREILESLAKRGEKIVVTSEVFPSLKFGTHLESLCGIEINHKKDGYEVRACSFANRTDLQLYIVAVDVMKTLTGTKALLEDDEEQEIANLKEYLSEKWINEQLDISAKANCALVKHFGKPVIMDGMFMSICFGPIIAQSLDLDFSNPTMEAFYSLQDYLTNLQWLFYDKKDTSTKLAMSNPINTDDEPLRISLIYAENGKVAPFDYVSYADVIGLMDKDTGLVRVIHIEDFPMIVSPDDFNMLDDYQFAVKDELSYQSFRQMMDKAQLYQVDDLFYRPTFLGNGYDNKQRTFVLMWNPAVSSVKLDDHVNDIPNLLTGDFNWSVYEHGKARKNDRFVMIRCGKGRTGLVMSGIFASNPYQAGDWSGRGRKVYYMNLTPNFIADPERLENLITTEDLQKAIPSFDWTGGHSGRLLTQEQAVQLENLLADYLPQFCNNVDGKTVNGFSLPQNDN